jgi:hypothetical protein
MCGTVLLQVYIINCKNIDAIHCEDLLISKPRMFLPFFYTVLLTTELGTIYFHCVQQSLGLQ